MDVPLVYKFVVSSTPRFANMERVMGMAVNYFTNIATMVQKSSPEEYSNFRKLEAESTNAIYLGKEAIKKWAVSPTLESVMEFYDADGRAIKAIEQMVEVTKNPYYINYINIEKTYSAQMQIDKLRSTVINELQILKELSRREDPEIFRSMVAFLSADEKEHAGEVLRELQKIKTPNILAVYLCGVVAKTIGRSAVESLIERWRDAVLEVADTKTATIETAPSTAAWFVNRWGLFPTTPYMGLRELLKGYNATIDDSLSDIQNLRKCASKVMIIDKNMGREIDYNILPLVDTEYIESGKLWTSDTNGLNKLIWKRFDTVKETTSGKSSSPLIRVDTSDGSETAGDETTGDEFAVSSKCIIVEHCGTDYRTLGRAFGAKYTPGDTFDDVIKGVSSRSERYNAIQEEYILNRCGDHHRDSTVKWWMDIKHEQKSTSNMKENMLRELLENIKELPAVSQDFRDRCRVGYQEVIIGNLLKFMDSVDDDSRERRCVLVVQMNDILVEFRRKLEGVMTRIVHPGLFTRRADMQTHLRNVYADVMRGTIEEMDSPPSKWLSVEMTLKEYYTTRLHPD